MLITRQPVRHLKNNIAEILKIILIIQSNDCLRTESVEVILKMPILITYLLIMIKC